ncbi:nucleotidyltransferase, putative [Plasmodium gaboni]|uniref:Nucleotidyltransferase, putative n=1 Tax=Plasmodium gaboni TaxID=647221 RepID=A0ABY1US54_9APIC|nr:nucleotidyltransferase, putative [Plasmodium gaboni]
MEDDYYFFLFQEEESEQVKEAKQDLHNALKKNREKIKNVSNNKPMEKASSIIWLGDNDDNIKNEYRKYDERKKDRDKKKSEGEINNLSSDKRNIINKTNNEWVENYKQNKYHSYDGGDDNVDSFNLKEIQIKKRKKETSSSKNDMEYTYCQNKDSFDKYNNKKKARKNDDINDHLNNNKNKYNFDNIEHKKLDDKEDIVTNSNVKHLSNMDNNNQKNLDEKEKKKNNKKNNKKNSKGTSNNSHISISSNSSLSTLSSDDSTSTNYLPSSKKKTNINENTYSKKYSNDPSDIIQGSGSNMKKKSLSHNKIYKEEKRKNSSFLSNETNIEAGTHKKEYGQRDKNINNVCKSNMHKNILKKFKINYKNLSSMEKEYYNYMIKKLDINYDDEKKVLYTDSLFNEKFLYMISKENNNFNFLGYLEYACFYILEWLTPTKEEKLLKLKSLIKLELLVKSLFPQSNMEVFGSYTSGLSLPSSDIDVCIMNIKENDLDCLYILAYGLIKLNIACDIRIIKDARVKILKYMDKELGVQIDICINQKSSKETTDFIIKQMKKYIYLRPLVILLKFFLNSRNLNETYIGGIGSFLLSCMVLHFLQMHTSTFDNNHFNNTYLIKLLIEFFYFYSIDYKLHETCAVVRGLGHILPRRLRKEYEYNDQRLCFENPIDTSIDIGRNTYRIRYILYLFSYTYCNFISLISKLRKHSNNFYFSYIPNVDEKSDTNNKKKNIKSIENKNCNINNNKKKNYIYGSKIKSNCIYPLFYGNIFNPDHIIFTKRYKNDFPSNDWDIRHFDFIFTKQEINNMFNMSCEDISSYVKNDYMSMEPYSMLYEHMDKTFSHSFEVYNNIFKYSSSHDI